MMGAPVFVFHDAEGDRLFIASKGPGGSPPNAIKVYDGVSSSSGRARPARAIHWPSGGTYFPPQPLWVSRR
jgi:hypothetical protein